ncbi:MAG: histidine kinase [Rubrivivax sp.]|nr:histidine kinase [Rubrivivax sp.]
METATFLPGRRHGVAPLVGWRRVAVTLGICAVLFALFSTFWKTSLAGLALRMFGVALLLMLVFGLFEQWPRRLPRWLARWVLQVAAVGVTVPLAWVTIYVLSTPPGQPPFWQVEGRAGGFGVLMASSLLVAPWVALAALVRQREAFAREQALAFQLERSELERQAGDARLRLLQAQVQPHFLFNTLANVRALVNAGSPQAPQVLDHLIDYLRAAVPRLSAAATTLGDEAQLVRAYLELMRMRMPDRMHFTLDVDEAARGLACPPATLMTLVENAVRHGIDPAEDGGGIDVQVRVQGGRCRACVCDTGLGLQRSSSGGGGGLGTGLSSLRERLALAFGGDAHLRVSALEPRGVRAEVDFPARPAAPPTAQDLSGRPA